MWPTLLFYRKSPQLYTSESVYEVPDPAQQNYYAPVGGNRASLSASAQQKIDFSENVAYGAKLSDVSSDAL